jgi:carnosine N-methyltransferase
MDKAKRSGWDQGPRAAQPHGCAQKRQRDGGNYSSRGGGSSAGGSLQPAEQAPADDEEQQLSLVEAALAGYSAAASAHIERVQAQHSALPPSHGRMWPQLEGKVRTMQAAAATNQAALHAIHPPCERPNGSDCGAQPTAYHDERVRGLLLQCVREWAAEGADERCACFEPLLRLACHKFQAVEGADGLGQRAERAQISLLVPGAGLARLPFELAALGFAVTACEFSLYHLVGANFFLNTWAAQQALRSNAEGQERLPLEIAPWCLETSCCRTVQDLGRRVLVPGGDGASAARIRHVCAQGKLQMLAGDFLELFPVAADPSPQHKHQHSASSGGSHESVKDGGGAGTWDGIVTCFFIDAAPNIFEYLTRIAALLKPGVGQPATKAYQL